MNRPESPKMAELRQALQAVPPNDPRRWKRHQVRLLIRHVKQQRDRFLALQTLDEQTKKEIYRTMRRAINRLYVAQIQRSGFEVFALSFAGFLVLLPAFIPLWKWVSKAELFSPEGMQRSWEQTIWLAHHPLNCILFVLGFVIACGLIFAFPRSNRGAVNPVWLLIYPAILVLSLASNPPWGEGATHGWWFGPYYSLLLGADVIAIWAVGVLVMLVPTLLLLARRLRNQADARILVGLITLMEEIELNHRRWDELGFRAGLSKRLESIAELFGSGLPAAYSIEDEVFREWMSFRSLRVAAYIRDLKRWLAVPRSDTRRYLLLALAELIVCIGRGDWDSIPMGECAPVSRRLSRIRSLLTTARILGASILPAAILTGLHWFHHDPPSQINGYLILAAAAWLTTGLISLLDPLYSSRLESFKAALQFLPGAKKD